MLKKIILLSMCVLLINVAGYGYSEENLSLIEYQKYGESYENDSLSSRLSRLENDLFGMTQSGDIDKRIEMIVRMSNSNNYEFNTPQNYEIPKQKKKSNFKNFWNNITSDITDLGTMTGFIPPIYGYGSYSGNYSNGYNNYYGSNYPRRYTTGYNNGFNNKYHNRFNHRYYSQYPYNNYHDNFHPHCCHNPMHTPPHFYPNNTVSAPMIYPNSQPIVPTDSYNNYFTSSTVRILND